ncbi:MFS transporter, SP family, sugar:H+ symporter [Galdieria sulphuraria]|uniref:MFS transporter, SP family, sugar:H+ symporter n=1 Tax=Galdieria sulphuraria TaxID=130081 RepID=M2XZG7_GALSU|nr:MFS transporter, SP family, sugar:H+ symporter [Galdieria sulphuraria]EME28969.1 MFS transporter, SP family, sugar:H+ symporter [Galdieria sulphuraria]|eukprot:XP_005705489.1 MFS transporter, SP family, sugar:H+ symporter [Galdieria sulphuraria]
MRWFSTENITTRLYVLSLVVAFGGCTVGIDISLVNGAQMFFVSRFHLNDSLHGLTSAATLIGAVIGSFMSSIINLFLGRKGAMFVASFVAVGAGLIEALANVWGVLLFARIFLGTSFGIYSATIPIYLSESAPAVVRGALTAIYQLSLTFGLFFGSIADAAFVQVDNGWRLMLGSVIVPPFCCLIGLIFTPESPRWLIFKRKEAEAFQCLLKLRKTETEALEDLSRIKDSTMIDSQRDTWYQVLKKILMTKRIRRAVSVGIFLQVARQLSGVNAMSYYIDIVLRKAGLSISTTIYISVAYMFGTVLFTLPLFWIVDRLGRRILLVATMPVISLMLLLIGFSFYGNEHIRISLCLVGFFIMRAFFSPGLGPVSWIITSEIFPLQVRAECLAIVSFASYAFNFVISFAFPDMLSQMKAQGAFSFFSGFTLLSWIIFFLYVPETKGIELESVEQLFEKPWSEYSRKHIQQAAEFLSCRRKKASCIDMIQSSSSERTASINEKERKAEE